MICRKERTRLLSRLVVSSRYAQLRGRVRKYHCPGADADDLVGELNVGIMEACRSVKMTIGDPMEFLLSRGYRHVQSQVSSALNHGVIEECLVCGRQRPYRRNPCARCGARDFYLHSRQVPLIVDDDGAILLPEGAFRRTKSRVEA